MTTGLVGQRSTCLKSLKSSTRTISRIIVLTAFVSALLTRSGLSSKTSDLDEALFQAFDKGDLRQVKRLLSLGADVNAKGLFDSTPLISAASYGDVALIKELISRGADVNAKNKVGSSALMMASGYPNVVEILKEAGAGQ